MFAYVSLDQEEVRAALCPPFQKTKNLKWRKKRSTSAVPGWKGSLPHADHVKEPIEYFRGLLSRNTIENMVFQSNLYAIQCDPTTPLNVTFEEIEQFMGICLHMSVHGLPHTRMFWVTKTRVDCVADTMSMKRWEAIKCFLHFANNDEQVPAGQPGYDKLFKVRPLLTALQESFNRIPMDEHLCVDEQIVPFKGKSQLKQYIPMKPKRWGYKIFVLCDRNGIAYNFDFYTGPITSVEGFPDLGASGNIVLKLASIVVQYMSHKMFYDNWFCGVDLQLQLEKVGIHSVGTVRQNRLAGCTFTEDKVMKTYRRGTYEEKETTHDGTALTAVKWFDNRPVTLLSTFAAATPTSNVERWDKKRKEVITVTRPNIIQLYNESMGGVDLMDSLIALYRTKIRSKKWYHRIVFHMLDLTTVESWLLYRRDCKDVGLTQNAQLSLLDFKIDIAHCLCKENKGGLKRKGRPSQSTESALDGKKHRRPACPLPPQPVRLDQTNHWPTMVSQKGRCKYPGCKGIVRVKCTKCEVYLCLTSEKNCFVKLHTEKR